MLTQPCAEAILLPIKDNQWNEETTFPLDSAVRLLRMPFNSFCMLRELRQEQKDTVINKRRI